jgi:hypothetical protein
MSSPSAEVEARLAWLASAGTEEEALLIESALVNQTFKPDEDDTKESAS